MDYIDLGAMATAVFKRDRPSIRAAQCFADIEREGMPELVQQWEIIRLTLERMPDEVLTASSSYAVRRRCAGSPLCREDLMSLVRYMIAAEGRLRYRRARFSGYNPTIVPTVARWPYRLGSSGKKASASCRLRGVNNV